MSAAETAKLDCGAPRNNLVNPLLTDMYQITMAYAYWKEGRQETPAVFDLFFRKNPFGGEHTIFAGLEEVLRHLTHFRFTPEHVDYLRELLPHADAGFFDWLAALDCSEVRVHALPEGTLCFPRVPVITVEGPLGVCQLLETTLLTLVNFASLMATNASRFRAAAGSDKLLMEFGLRRAQGPDGGISASRYSYLGGFDGTSNVLACHLFGMQCGGTHAHSFVSSYTSLDQVSEFELGGVPIKERALHHLREKGWDATASRSELAAFLAYAKAFPNGFLALVDTYDTLQSGVLNFLAVTLALADAGIHSVGIRLDSGDLAYLSRQCRAQFARVAKEHDLPWVQALRIVASNDINEAVLHSLAEQGHSIDSFGIGTNLVTCQAQPALGMVYKLVEIDHVPRIKLSQEISKVTLPGAKRCYRLIGSEGNPLLDIMVRKGEPVPEAGKRLLCRHPFDEKKRVYVTPTEVATMHKLWFDGPRGGLQRALPLMEAQREYVQEQLRRMREDHLRPLNPTPYKVSVSPSLYNFIHELWMSEVPIPELQ